MGNYNIKKGDPEYQRYIHSSEWKKKAEERLSFDSYICQVCGKPATEVHHLTYENFRNERNEDLVSLCSACHCMAERIYDPKEYPWAMTEVKPEGNNFMAAMRTDALKLAPVVLEYILKARGSDIEGLMTLREPCDKDKKKYWLSLKNAVNALCKKRYLMNCAEDRTDLMLSAITNHIAVVCLGQMEHYLRNAIQAKLHEIVTTEYLLFEKWNMVSEFLGISPSTMQTLKRDSGTSFGPSLRETVLYYCALDASAGIDVPPGFCCLTSEDYQMLNGMSAYMKGVSGDGYFKGEELIGGKNNA